jgi:hypothetical protein
MVKHCEQSVPEPAFLKGWETPTYAVFQERTCLNFTKGQSSGRSRVEQGQVSARLLFFCETQLKSQHAYFETIQLKSQQSHMPTST